MLRKFWNSMCNKYREFLKWFYKALMDVYGTPSLITVDLFVFFIASIFWCKIHTNSPHIELFKEFIEISALVVVASFSTSNYFSILDISREDSTNAQIKLFCALNPVLFLGSLYFIEEPLMVVSFIISIYLLFIRTNYIIYSDPQVKPIHRIEQLIMYKEENIPSLIGYTFILIFLDSFEFYYAFISVSEYKVFEEYTSFKKDFINGAAALHLTLSSIKYFNFIKGDDAANKIFDKLEESVPKEAKETVINELLDELINKTSKSG